MGKESEYGTKLRLLRVMMAILERPKGYTKRELAERYNTSLDTIKKDIEAFRNVGFSIDYDNKYRYYFMESNPHKKLKDLLHFTEEDQFLLEQAIDSIEPHSRRAKLLKQKLASLYDYKKLGLSYLRKPYLDKVDMMMKAKEEKKRIWLIGYHSSHSGKISDRLVEPFHPSPPDDMLHAFDVDKKDLRHFRISRIKRVKLIEEPWEYENHHNVILTDPFRIVEKNQVLVHLRIGVGAYNELIERFPLTKNYLEDSVEEGMYDFQCMVNHKFYGLTNFILGNYHSKIEIIEPESLVIHLRQTVKNMSFWEEK